MATTQSCTDTPATNPARAKQLMQQADKLFDSQRFRDAALLYIKISDDDPTLLHAVYNLSLCYIEMVFACFVFNVTCQQDLLDKAVLLLTRLVEFDYPDALVARAACYEKKV